MGQRMEGFPRTNKRKMKSTDQKPLFKNSDNYGSMKLLLDISSTTTLFAQSSTPFTSILHLTSTHLPYIQNLYCLLVASCPSNLLVYLRDRSVSQGHICISGTDLFNCVLIH